MCVDAGLGVIIPALCKFKYCSWFASLRPCVHELYDNNGVVSLPLLGPNVFQSRILVKVGAKVVRSAGDERHHGLYGFLSYAYMCFAVL